MTEIDVLEPVFVEFIPAQLETGKLYVSMHYGTTVHLCASGCGERIVLPLHPAQWRLTYDGRGVSLWPSVGNWNYRCKSHYWVRNNRIEWAPKWDRARIQAGRQRDGQELDSFYDMGSDPEHVQQSKSPWTAIWRRLRGGTGTR